MDDTEVRYLFNKTCMTLNDYQKGIGEICRGVQRINARLKEFKTENLSAEIDDVIEGYYNGISNARETIDGLTERLTELERFVEVIEDLENKVEQFGEIKELMKGTAEALNEIMKDVASEKGKSSKLKNYSEKIDPLKTELHRQKYDESGEMEATLEGLDETVVWLQNKIEYKKKILDVIG